MSPSRSGTKVRSSRSKADLLLVGLTGGIAAGKSAVAAILEQKGCFVFYADRTAAKLQAPGLPAFRRIIARFGQDILAPDGTIDRRRLARTVFADQQARRDLESIVHPLVFKEQTRSMERCAAERRSGIFVVEAALVFETGRAASFDRTIVVHCRRDIQLARVAGRYGISLRAATVRARSQMSQRDKLKLSDYAIDTSGTPAETVEQVERVFAALVRDSEEKLRYRLSRRSGCS